MKKLTEYKELTVEEVKGMEWPIKNCVYFRTGYGRWSYKPTELAGFKWNAIMPFYLKGCGWVSRVAQVFERFPRDVPKAVTPLPADKPFLAYLTQRNLEKIKEFYFDKNELYVWDNYKWITYNYYNIIYDHYAIDVSAQWAKENFPEIVEAMGYGSILDEGGGIAGHRLDGEIYDEYWNPLPDRLKPIDSDSDEKVARTTEKSSEVEPPADVPEPKYKKGQLLKNTSKHAKDWSALPVAEAEWDALAGCYVYHFLSSLIKLREDELIPAEPEKIEWKYKTLEDIQEHFKVTGKVTLKDYIEAARETEGEK